MSSSKKETNENKKVDIVDIKYKFNKDLDIGTTDKEVVELQKRMKEEGFFSYPHFTEYYGDVTKKAVLDYQIAKGIIKSSNDLGAGRVGPSTRGILNK